MSEAKLGDDIRIPVEEPVGKEENRSLTGSLQLGMSFPRCDSAFPLPVVSLQF